MLSAGPALIMMRLYGKWSCLWWSLLLAGLTTADPRQDVSARGWRPQSSWWHNYPQAVLGFPQGLDRRNPDVDFQARQLSANNPINVQCEEDLMVINVQRDLYGTGKLVKPSDLTLGPQKCNPSSQSTNTIVTFQNRLEDCGSSLEMTSDWLIYSTHLNYNPTPSSNVPIVRTNSAVVSIQCYYPRHGNVSSNAIKPTWTPFSSTVSEQQKLAFSLQLMTDDWSAPRTTTVFQLGDLFHIQASVDTSNHVPMMIFVDSCVATLSPDIRSSPQYDIIAMSGCLVDGKQADSSSAFRSPRPQKNVLQFTVDAFVFAGMGSSTIYITCNLRAAADTQTPDPIHKACSFSKTNNVWSPLEGTSDICNCCESGNCVASPSQSRRVGLSMQGGRRTGKRAALVDTYSEDHGLATLGPLLVLGPDSNKASVVTQESKPLALWVLVTVGFLSTIVLAVCAVVGISLCKKLK